jgi:hypothetical protein
LAARLRYASVFARNSRRLTTIGSSEFLREIHPDLKILYRARASASRMRRLLAAASGLRRKLRAN